MRIRTIATFSLLLSVLSCHIRANSPCQCRMAGGCAVEWESIYGEPYADGTDPADYDDWGNYTGPIDVPAECRRSTPSQPEENRDE